MRQSRSFRRQKTPSVSPLQTRACIVRLNAFDPAGGKLLCRQAVEQEADIDDVVHMPPHVDIRRADEVRVDKLVLRQLVVEAHGRLGNGGCVRKGKSAGKPDCSKRRIFCSGKWPTASGLARRSVRPSSAGNCGSSGCPGPRIAPAMCGLSARP